MACSGFATRPLYLLVRDALAERIAAGDWKPGAIIPNERELARELGVSTGTVRKALELMEAELLVTRRQGRGTFVSDPWSDGSAARISRLRGGNGEQIPDRSGPAQITEGEANNMECVQLRLREQDPVYRIRRVHFHDNRPFMVEAATMPAALFPGFVDRDSFCNGLLVLARRHGILVGTAQERVSIGTAAADIARDLNVAPASPIMVLDRVVLTHDGLPMEWRLGWCRPTQHHCLSEMR
jgi:GntR family transcriptional regulator